MTPTINSAIQNVTRRKTDPGTIFNPNRTDLGSTLGCVVALDVGGYGLGHGYVQSRFARGFLEQCWIDEIMWSIASTEGTFANGEPYAAADWSLVSNSPMGVGAWRDGIACSLGTGNPTGDIGGGGGPRVSGSGNGAPRARAAAGCCGPRQVPRRPGLQHGLAGRQSGRHHRLSLRGLADGGWRLDRRPVRRLSGLALLRAPAARHERAGADRPGHAAPGQLRRGQTGAGRRPRSPRAR